MTDEEIAQLSALLDGHEQQIKNKVARFTHKAKVIWIFITKLPAPVAIKC